MRLALCVTPTLTPDHPSPQLPGTVVTLTASVTCNGTPEYRFWIRAPGGGWTIAQNYGTSPTFVWHTAARPYGDYGLEVDVRTQGTTVSYESVMPMPFSLTSCIGTSLATDKTSPQPTGTTVTLTAGATCAGTNQYRFWVHTPGAAWTVARDFSPTATFAWTPGGPGGDYGLEVDARSASAAANTIVPANQTFTVTACSGATLSHDLAAPQVPGATITLTGAAACDVTPHFRFWVQPPGGSWSSVRSYTSSPTFSWDTSGAPGIYGIEVDVRDVSRSTLTYDAVANISYTLAACSGATLATDLTAPQPSGA